MNALFNSKMIAPLAAALLLSGCSGSGHLTLVPQPSKSKIIKGSPTVAVNQGGRALIIEQGKTADTGVHGWVTIQSVGAKTLAGSDGTSAVIMNAPKPAVNGARGLSSQ